VIRARGLARRFGDKRALEPVDFELARGGFLVVTGPNGSGKTTLLRLCAGLLIPTAGELEVAAERGAIAAVPGSSLRPCTDSGSVIRLARMQPASLIRIFANER